MMSQITTHVLDTSRGQPAVDLPVSLHKKTAATWQCIARGKTDDQGRISDLLGDSNVLASGIYRLNFETSIYFNALSEATFYPHVDVVFSVDTGGQHYHIPLLLSAFGYSTYRGS